VLTIEDSHLKQIAGRAGRFKVAPLTASPLAGNDREDTASLLASSHPQDMAPASTLETQTTSSPSAGFVTTLMPSDLASLKKAMTRDVPNLTKAYIQPADQIFYRFASLLPPDTPFSYLLYRFVITAQAHPLFQTGIWKEAIQVSDLLQGIPGLSMKDRLTFVFAPANSRKPEMIPIIRELAQRIGESRPVPILELPGLKLELLDREGSASLDYVKELEILHKALVLYNWLSYRYEALFETRATAFHIKALVEKRIDQALFELGAEFRSKLGRQLKRRQWKEDHESTPYREEIPHSEALDPKQNIEDHLATADEGWPNDAPSEAMHLFHTPEHSSPISSNA
jgi:ATP-dependent RNA helicase SUPV3L1/SUV3